MKIETEETARRLIAEDNERHVQHRCEGQSLFHPEAGNHYISPEVAAVFTIEEIWEMLNLHFRGDDGYAEPLGTPEADRSLYAVDGRLVWVVTFYRPHVTVVTFTVFS
jgi:hypothetical protein